jgi:AcrR family transcriptional regulator
MSPGDDRQRRLTRELLVEAGLALIDEDGLDGLSMRSLADRLDVKAASLYWHVRDRQELLDLLAEGLLDMVPRPRPGAGWRQSVRSTAAALARTVASRRDAGRLLLAVPGALNHSPTFRELAAQLGSAGLGDAEAAAVATMVMTGVLSAPAPADARAPALDPSGIAEVAVDTGSRGVVLRAGSPAMETLFAVPRDQPAAAPAVERGDRVVVRRLRGVGHGEIELNPRRPWRVRIQAPTWHTVVDAAGLDLRGIHVDSGAAKVECFLPPPQGVVPIDVSSGVAGVALHRPAGVAVVAHLSTGVVKARLDDFVLNVSVSDLRWESAAASAAADRYDLRLNSGAVKVTLDTYQPKPSSVHKEPRLDRAPASALDILLDGVEARVSSKA